MVLGRKLDPEADEVYRKIVELENKAQDITDKKMSNLETELRGMEHGVEGNEKQKKVVVSPRHFYRNRLDCFRNRSKCNSTRSFNYLTLVYRCYSEGSTMRLSTNNWLFPALGFAGTEKTVRRRF